MIEYEGAVSKGAAVTQALKLYNQVRAHSLALVDGMSAEDMSAQAFEDASPAKWHLAHTTWFFETFLLSVLDTAYRPFDPSFRMLFNSYYDNVGTRPLRARRGLLTRPPLDLVLDWRRHVDREVTDFLKAADESIVAQALPLLHLGCAHEEQHQELMVTDALALFATHPLEPGWQKPGEAASAPALPMDFITLPGGMTEIGAPAEGFAFDNERPRHAVLLRPHALASRPVNNGEWLAFMADGGYRRPILWQDDGWAISRARQWQAPEYWDFRDNVWTVMTPSGRQRLDENAPVRHISWYEADAYASWAQSLRPGARLPTEAEWEAAADSLPQASLGHVWEWTADCHRPYPGWRAPPGAMGEYNGKFMAGRMVLRGGSCATPPRHMRPSVRNFWQPETRWQFTGIRLAEDL